MNLVSARRLGYRPSRAVRVPCSKGLNMHRRRNAFSVTLLATLAATATTAGAATFVVRTVASGNPGPSGEQINRNGGQAPVEVQANHSGSRITPYDPIPPSAPFESHVRVSSQAWARADMGGVHLRATSSGLAEDAEPFYSASFSGRAVASGGFGDSFVIGAPGSAGVMSASVGFSAQGLLSGATSVAGSVNPTFPGTADATLEWSARMVVLDNLGTLSEISLSGACSSRGGSALNCAGDTLGMHWLNLSFSAGQTLDLSIEGEVRANVFGGQYYGGMASADSQALFGNTLAWGGFRDVRDAANGAVAGFSAVSDSSGFDYAQPFASAVPEPSTWVLLLGGLVGLRLLRRRTREA